MHRSTIYKRHESLELFLTKYGYNTFEAGMEKMGGKERNFLSTAFSTILLETSLKTTYAQ